MTAMVIGSNSMMPCAKPGWRAGDACSLEFDIRSAFRVFAPSSCLATVHHGEIAPGAEIDLADGGHKQQPWESSRHQLVAVPTIAAADDPNRNKRLPISGSGG
ncbi:MAG: hypothetical protein WBV35_16635 [Steroidobacteraceae bacterium]